MLLNKIFRMGVDINTSHLKWVQIYHVPHQIAQVKGYGIIPLNEKQEALSEALKSPDLSAALSKSTTGIALPDSSVQKTTLTLDANLSILQLRKIFRETAGSLFNQPIKALHYQYQVLGFSKKHTTQLNFLLVAVQKEVIEKWLAVLKTSDLKPALIDVESFALERGQEILKNQQITWEKNLDIYEFKNQSEDLSVSLGLAMHPDLKRRRWFLS